MKPIASLSILMLVTACTHASVRHVFVPNTPDARECWQACKATETHCLGGESERQTNNYLRADVDMGSKESACDDERKDCLVSCPGAREEWRAER